MTGTSGVSEKPFENELEYLDDRVDDLIAAGERVIAPYLSPAQFAPLPTDIFIVSWMKSGTTLTQNLFYQLMVLTGRVPTDPTGYNYRDISTVVPFIEMSYLCGVHHSVHPYTPCAWKSHSTAAEFSKDAYKPCKILYLIREGKTVARSFIDFVSDWIVNEPCVKHLHEPYYHHYFNAMFLNHRRDKTNNTWVKQEEPGWWFTHVRDWLKSPNPNVLFLIYEDMVKDLPNTIRILASIVGVNVTDEIIAQVIARCDRNVMSNDSRFNDIMVSEYFGFPTEGGRRVRKENDKGFGKFSLSDDCVRRYDEMFCETFSVADYDALVAQLRTRNVELLSKWNIC